MFTPDDIDTSRIDVDALLRRRGIAVVEGLRQTPCRRWLEQRGYVLEEVDFGRPFSEVLAHLGSLFGWTGEYELNDGFSFPVSAQGGHVLVVRNPESLAMSDEDQFNGFLRVASDHSLLHLACGSRFFVLLIIARGSSLPGRTYDQSKLPTTYWNLNARKHGFLE